jgi:hypothetical protein
VLKKNIRYKIRRSDEMKFIKESIKNENVTKADVFFVLNLLEITNEELIVEAESFAEIGRKFKKSRQQIGVAMNRLMNLNIITRINKDYYFNEEYIGIIKD